MLKWKIFAFFIGIIFFSALAIVKPANAFQIQQLPGTETKNDFVLGPGRTEVVMDRGGEATREIIITNRLGSEMKFKVEIEDFVGSRDVEQNINLLGLQKGPYSLRDYLFPDVMEFTLQHGERIFLPVKISIPSDARPGGLYGAVIITTEPVSAPGEKNTAQIRTITRLGSLFFVRVNGEAIEEGRLVDFTADKAWYEKPPVIFKITSENNGNVHLANSGKIEIKNLLGRVVGSIAIQPYFVLPDSLKAKEARWEKGLMLGRYMATIALNMGYKDKIDYKTVIFWVLPWKVIAVFLIIAVLIASLITWIAKNFKITRKGEPPTSPLPPSSSSNNDLPNDNQ